MRSLLWLLPLVALGCNRAPDQLERGRDLFMHNQIDAAMPFLLRAARGRHPNPDAYAWVGEARRRLGRPERADSAARLALSIEPCNSFAHEVLGANYDPQYSTWRGVNADSSWRHFVAAVTCDSSNGSAWTGVWLQAMGRGDTLMERRALRALVETRFFTPAVLAYGRWLLRGLPEHALLVVNGDMDTFPLYVLQASEDLRPDVAIANRSLLELAWYRRRLRDHDGVRVPFSPRELDQLEGVPGPDNTVEKAGDRMVQGWYRMLQAGTLGRPLAVSTTVPHPPVPIDHLMLAGAYFRVTRAPAPANTDTAATRASLTSLHPSDFTGPWTSEGDRSPVRYLYTPLLGANVVATAAQLHGVCMLAGQPTRAREIRSWARSFATGAGLDTATVHMVERMGEARARPPEGAAPESAAAKGAEQGS